ncbi:MAG: DUF177 domain-containing protein [Geminicoccaceae bacterium]
MAQDPEFSRLMMLGELPERDGRPFAIAADPEECRRVALRLELVALTSLTFGGRLEHGPRPGVLILRGRLEADATQRCVVTLEPVAAHLDVEIERYFVLGPEAAVEEILISPDDEEPEPLDGSWLDLGEIAVEELALALDPYPRAADADARLEAQRAAMGGDAGTDAAGSAFAALAALRDRRKES